MQALPATFIEAEAEQFARNWFTSLGAAPFLNTGHTFLDPAAAQAFVRQIIKAYAAAHPFNAAKMVEVAVLGWGEAKVRGAVDDLQAWIDKIEHERTARAPLKAISG
jgi:hypothetical protein